MKNNLRALGFEMNDHQRPGFPIVTLLCYSFIATVIATLVTTLSMLGFQEHLTEDLNIDWKRELADLRIPETNEGLLIWSWKTVIFYFSCIVSSVAARQSYISKREWFKLDAKSRDKPFGHYHGPILLGTFSGWAVLSLIILSDIMSASAAISLYTAMTIAMQAAFHWIPLAILMSGITLFIADSELSGETRAVIYTRPIYFALAMGLMGFIVLRYTAPIVTGIDRKDVIEGAIFEYHMLIGTFIAWFVLMLSWALQLVEQKYQRTRNFAGKRLETSSSRGPQFTLLLQDTDKATAFKPDETNLSDENSIGTGTWKQIPEGTVVLWNRSKPDAPNYWGDLWIVTIEADSAIYEGYHDTNHPRTGTANFVGHVRVRDT